MSNAAPFPLLPENLTSSVLLDYRIMAASQAFLPNPNIFQGDAAALNAAFSKALEQGNLSDEALRTRFSQHAAELGLPDTNEAFAAYKGAHRTDVAWLHGSTALTPSEAEAFVNRFTLIAAQSNDAYGFSAAVLFDTVEKRYVLTIRDTEFRPESGANGENLGGNASRDVGGADKQQMVGTGAAWGQIGSAEKFMQNLMSGNDPRIPADALGNIRIVAGSLSGNIALNLFVMHPEWFAQGD